MFGGPAEVPERCWVQAVNESTLCTAHATAVARCPATSTAPDATRELTPQYEVWAKRLSSFLPLAFAQVTNATKPKRHYESRYA